MAISFVRQGTTATGTSVTSLGPSFSTNTTAGNIVIVVVGCALGTHVSSISGMGATDWAALRTQTGTNATSELWAGTVVTPGTSLTVNITPSSNAVALVCEVSGVTVTTDGVNSTASTSGSFTTGNITTTNANDFIISGFDGIGSVTITDPSSPWNALTGASAGTSSGKETAHAVYQIVSSTGSFNPTWSYTDGVGQAAATIAAIQSTAAAVILPAPAIKAPKQRRRIALVHVKAKHQLHGRLLFAPSQVITSTGTASGHATVTGRFAAFDKWTSAITGAATVASHFVATSRQVGTVSGTRASAAGVFRATGRTQATTIGAAVFASHFVATARQTGAISGARAVVAAAFAATARNTGNTAPHAVVTSSLQATGRFNAVTAGAAIIVANLRAPSAALKGSATGVATSSSHFVATARQTGASTGSFAITAHWTAKTGWTASIAGQGIVVSSFRATARQTSATTGHGTLTASFRATDRTSGTAVASAVLTSHFTAQTAQRATTTGLGSISGVFRATAREQSVTTGQGVVNGRGSTSGTIFSVHGQVVVTAHLSATGRLTSASVGQIAITSHFTALARLVTTISGHTAIAGTLKATALQVGSAQGVSHLTASFQATARTRTVATGSASITTHFQSTARQAATIAGHGVASGSLRATSRQTSTTIGLAVITGHGIASGQANFITGHAVLSGHLAVQARFSSQITVAAGVIGKTSQRASARGVSTGAANVTGYFPDISSTVRARAQAVGISVVHGSGLAIKRPVFTQPLPQAEAATQRNTKQFITHITRAGERWDTLAWRYYGDASLIGPIIQLNPQIPIESVFEAGLVIGVPILRVSRVVKDQSKLPPWKQAA